MPLNRQPVCKNTRWTVPPKTRRFNSNPELVVSDSVSATLPAWKRGTWVTYALSPDKGGAGVIDRHCTDFQIPIWVTSRCIFFRRRKSHAGTWMGAHHRAWSRAIYQAAATSNLFDSLNYGKNKCAGRVGGKWICIFIKREHDMLTWWCGYVCAFLPARPAVWYKNGSEGISQHVLESSC